MAEEGGCELCLWPAHGRTVAQGYRRPAAGRSPSRTCSLWPILGQKATEAKEQWKELKAVYQDHVEAIKCALTQALPQAEEAQRKYTELQEAYKQLQAKVHLEEKESREGGRGKLGWT